MVGPAILADVCLGKTGDAERSATSRAYALSADLPIPKGAISFEGKVPAPWRATSWGWSRCPSWIRTPPSPFSSAPRERSCCELPPPRSLGPAGIRGRGPRVRQRGEGTTGLEAVRVKAEGPPAWLSRDQKGSRKKYYQFTAIDDCTRIRVLRIYDRLNQQTAIRFVGRTPRSEPGQLTRRVLISDRPAGECSHTVRVRAPGRNRTCDTRFRKPLLYPPRHGGARPRPNGAWRPSHAASAT